LAHFGECRPASNKRGSDNGQPQQPAATLALRHLHAARAPYDFGPLSMLANRLTMLHDPHPDNGLEMNFRSTRAGSLERVEIQPLKP
jgi:hypothetical protein